MDTPEAHGKGYAENAGVREDMCGRRVREAVVNRTFVNFTTAFLGILLVSFTLVFLTHLVGQVGAVRTEDLGARQTGSPATR